jgi:hypothetical protein
MSLRTASCARDALLLLAAGALAAPGAVRAEEPAPAGGGALRVTADPPRIVLGRADGAELRVAAPPEIEELSITASVGRVEGVRKLPGGGFVARYRPPAERVPQVAIVAAAAHTARGLEDGWIAIPLSGEGDARVPGEPGSEVTLRIGDRAFGPRKVGSDGVAMIPVIVPPGVREAHQGFRPIDLRVPETPLLHAIQDRTHIHADREEEVHVVAYLVAPLGAARRGDVPVLVPSRGTVAVTVREAGAFNVIWSLPPGLAGEERLSIRVPAAPISRAVLRVEGTVGPPALIAVSFDRDALVAGGDAAVVTARALDGGGNQVPAQLSLSARGALLSDVEERRPGELVARIAAGETLRAHEAVVVASASKAGIAGSRSLPLVAAEPAAARFEPTEPVVRSDGAREAILRLTLADRFGNAASSVPVVTAARGRVVGVAEGARGEYAVRYVGPAVDGASRDEIVARVGAVRATAAPLVASPTPALLVSARAGSHEVGGRFTGNRGVVVERPPTSLSRCAGARSSRGGSSWRAPGANRDGRGGPRRCQRPPGRCRTCGARGLRVGGRPPRSGWRGGSGAARPFLGLRAQLGDPVPRGIAARRRGGRPRPVRGDRPVGRRAVRCGDLTWQRSSSSMTNP